MNCKKCGKPLPEGYKKRLCEGCIGKRVDWGKKAGTAVIGIGAAISTVLIAIANKGNKD